METRKDTTACLIPEPTQLCLFSLFQGLGKWANSWERKKRRYYDSIITTTLKLIIVITGYNADRTWHTLDACRPLRTKENWKFCCYSRGTQYSKQVDTAQRFSLREGRGREMIGAHNTLAFGDKGMLPRNLFLSHQTQNIDRTQNTIQDWGHWEQKRAGQLTAALQNL